MPRLPRLLALAVPLLVGVAACGGSGTALPSALPTSAPSVAAATPVPTPDCAKDALITLTAGKLTIGTDNPAIAPYYLAASPQPSGSPWEIGDPRTGEGLEAATAYAVAQKLGFTKDDVVWVAMPLQTATGPGAKPFDYYLAQVQYSPELSQAVDMSDGYFDVDQTVVALKDNAIANATSVAALKAFKLGAPLGSSYDTVTDLRSRGARGEGDRRARRRPADRVPPARHPANERGDRRHLAGRRRGGALHHRDPEARSDHCRRCRQSADGVREPRPGRPEDGRDAQADHRQVDHQPGRARAHLTLSGMGSGDQPGASAKGSECG